jgi:hypothetical protein
MDPALKDWLQAGAWVATAFGVVVTVVKFWSEVKQGRLQRDRELRWRQAQAGKALNDEMQTDEYAWAALQMLDSERRTFKTSTGTVEVIASDITAALDADAGRGDEKGTFIRDSFDALFYFMAMLEHYISSGLIRPEDVAYPMEYYVPLLAMHEREVSEYLRRYDLWRARTFLERYEAWRGPEK